jgi:ABC-type sugar transport system substrate-binding protein
MDFVKCIKYGHLPLLLHGLIIPLLLSGCNEITGSSPSSISSDIEVPVRVAIVPPGFASPFHVAVKDGAVEMGTDIGWTIDVVATEREGDFAGQVILIEQEIQKGVAAVAVNPIDAEAIVTAVIAANESNTPIFMHNTITPVSEGQVVEYIGYDQWGGAVKLAEYTCQLLDGSGEVFILEGIPGFHTNRRTQGYIWGLEQSCPEVQVVGRQSAEWLRPMAIEIATAALIQNPEIDVFYGNSDEMGIGACMAAKKLGRQINEDIWCISVDGNNVTLNMIESNNMTATLGVYPYMIGATVIKQMQRYLNGEEIPYILETPSVVVDINNLEEYRSLATWTEPVEGSPETDNGQPTGP